LFGVIAVLFGLPAGFFLWMTSVPGTAFAGPLPAMTPALAESAARLRADVTAIASGPHNVAHPEALEHAALHIEGRLLALGYRVERQFFQAGGRQVRNIEAVIAPAAANAETLVVGAHYDSYGTAPGANDNGSGTAAVLELARRLADLRGRSALRIRLVLFVNEETPYFQTEQMGSLVYARRLAASGETVRGMLSLETMGYYSDAPGSQHYPFPLDLRYPDTGNFIAFVGTLSARTFVRGTVGDFRASAPFPSEGGTAPAFVQGIDWSDHWAFGQVGIPALMITDTAPFRYPHYHAAADTPDKLDYARLARVVDGLAALIRGWAGAPNG
jgi:Zn-dependent M28 family amino/carboxypeptidase